MNDVTHKLHYMIATGMLLCNVSCAANEPVQTAESVLAPLALTPDYQFPEYQANSDWAIIAQEVIINALSLNGTQYKYGGSSPDTGFDCSGFVRYVFKQAANLTLPRTAIAISQLGKQVRKTELQPGDLVFFNTLKSAFSHVGIYVGDNKFIHSPSSGGGVRVENMTESYWTARFNGAKRIDATNEKK